MNKFIFNVIYVISFVISGAIVVSAHLTSAQSEDDEFQSFPQKNIPFAPESTDPWSKGNR